MFIVVSPELGGQVCKGERSLRSLVGVSWNKCCANLKKLLEDQLVHLLSEQLILLQSF
jgi:hypothetical protein